MKEKLLIYANIHGGFYLIDATPENIQLLGRCQKEYRTRHSRKRLEYPAFDALDSLLKKYVLIAGDFQLHILASDTILRGVFSYCEF